MFALLLSACLLPAVIAGKPFPSGVPAPIVFQEKPAPWDVFPSPKTGLTLPADDAASGASLFDLCSGYAKATGQLGSYSDRVEVKLRSQRLQLSQRLELRPEALQEEFESMMLGAGFVIAPAFDGPIPIFRVLDREFLRDREIRSHAIYVEAKDVAVLERHPAVVFTTFVQLAHVDVRQLSKAMRALNTDAGIQQVLPAGKSSSIVLVGFGTQLASLRSVLLAMDAAAAAGIDERKVVFDVIKVEHAKAGDLAEILTVVFTHPPSSEVPRSASAVILSDARTNSIVARGTKAEMARIKALIAQMDVQVKAKK